MTDPSPRKCPKCAEEIQPEAKLCPHCGYRFFGWQSAPDILLWVIGIAGTALFLFLLVSVSS